jgi:hypothetical protein
LKSRSPSRIRQWLEQFESLDERFVADLSSKPTTVMKSIRPARVLDDSNGNSIWQFFRLTRPENRKSLAQLAQADLAKIGSGKN